MTNRSCMRYVVVCVVTFLFHEFCVAAMERETYDPVANIYLYSGRPNPTWPLSFDEWSQLNKIIQALPHSAHEIPGAYQFFGGLGYTGFHAYFSIISSYPDVYYVAADHQVVLSNPGGHFIYNDENKVIEQWFKDSAEKHGVQLAL